MPEDGSVTQPITSEGPADAQQLIAARLLALSEGEMLARVLSPAEIRQIAGELLAIVQESSGSEE